MASVLCPACKELRDIEKFGRDKYTKLKRSVYCKECRNRMAIEYNRKRTMKRRENKDFRDKDNLRRLNCWLKTEYGMTIEIYKEMFDMQKGLCAICSKSQTLEYGKGKKARMCIDHDHKTGKVRGLLCHCCNAGIGLFQENIELMKRAIEYLNKNKECD